MTKLRRDLPPVFLLGGRVNTLSAARTLGKRGVEVRILDNHGECYLASRSRHCDSYLDTPQSASTSEWWLDVLLKEGSGSVVFPCGDAGLEFLARNRAALEDAGCLPIEADGDSLLITLDKQETYERARELGIRSPRTVRASTVEDLADALRSLQFPFAVKPVSSHRFWEALMDYPEESANWLEHPKGLVLHNEREFLQLVEPLIALGIEVLATEVVVGPDSAYASYYTYLDTNGEPIFNFTKCKPRQFPIHFGMGTFHKTKWQPDVAELGLRFCQGLGIRGIANVEFKRDSRDGELALIECNARLTASDSLERRAGLDIPWIAYSYAIGVAVGVPERFPDDLCLWLPLNDVKAFRAYRRAGELTTAAWLASLAHRQSFTTFDPSDLGPVLATFGMRLRFIPARLGGTPTRWVRRVGSRIARRNGNTDLDSSTG